MFLSSCKPYPARLPAPAKRSHGTCPSGGLERLQPVATQAQFLPGLMGHWFTHSMYDANIQQLAQEVTRLAQEAKPPLVWLRIVADAVDDVDYTAAATLRSLHGFLKHGIRLVFSDVSDHVYAQLQRSAGSITRPRRFLRHGGFGGVREETQKLSDQEQLAGRWTYHDDKKADCSFLLAAPTTWRFVLSSPGRHGRGNELEVARFRGRGCLSWPA